MAVKCGIVGQDMPGRAMGAKEMVVAANLGKLLETAASVDIISPVPQSWVLFACFVFIG